VPFTIPVYAESLHRPWQIRAGLCLYALLSGLKPHSRFSALEKAEWESLKGLRKEGLRAVFSYLDAQTDDAALTRAVLASAVSLGAEALYPALFVAATRTGDGYRIDYRFKDQEQPCHTKVLVNAGGPWVNLVQDRISPVPPKLAVDLVQGTHIHLDQPISRSIFYGESPRDRRPVFIMPWKQGTLIGTTETVFTGDPDKIEPLPEEIAYLEETLGFYFPHYQGRVIGSVAGLRVLPAGQGKPAHRSRETILLPDEAQRPQLIAIYGGKLTTYRATAAWVMSLARKTLPEKKSLAYTAELPLT
jgi:glycerol-3-phosphate dehydrogenase